MAERVQQLTLASDPFIEGRIERDLEHSAAIVVGYLERDGGRPLAEPSLHEEAVFQHVSGECIHRMDASLARLFRLGEFPLRVHQQVQKLGDGIKALADFRLRRTLYDQLHGFVDAVDRIGELEAARDRQPIEKAGDGRCGGASRE